MITQIFNTIIPIRIFSCLMGVMNVCIRVIVFATKILRKISFHYKLFTLIFNQLSLC